MTEEENKPEKTEEEKKRDAINAIVLRQKRQDRFLKSLEGGVSVLKASKAADIDYKTIWRWRKDDEEFNIEVMAILDSRTMIVEDALFLNAAKGNLGAQVFYLKNRARDRWKDKFPEELNLNVKGGLEFNEFKILKEMTENDRKEYISKLLKVIRGENSKSTSGGQEKDKS